MIKTKTIQKVVQEEEQEDVLCDICGKSCGIEIQDMEGEVFLRFEYMELETHWGYYSSKDCEHWQAQVCEACVDTHLVPLLKFAKYEYPSFGKRKMIP
jgi:uncharacterized cysteine cluster protein YcgN (CxxCxxCC family)